MGTLLVWMHSSWLLGAAAFVLGSLFGSFLNVVIARLPNGENIAWPGSHCPKCKAPIHPLHNIPVLSWLWLRGRCAHCEASISPRYVFVELVTAALFAACAARFGATGAFLAASAFAAALVAVTFIDLQHWEIPDEIVLYGLPIVLVLRPLVFEAPWWSGLVGAVLGASFILLVRWTYFALRGIEAMGLGDVKLMAFTGGFLGVSSLLPTITLGSMLGALIGGLMVAFTRPTAEASKKPAGADAPTEDAKSLSEGPPPTEAQAAVEAAPTEDEEAWAEPPSKLRPGLVLRTGQRTLRWVVPLEMSGRTHVRFGFVTGTRWGPRRNIELTVGMFQDVPGWGHFEGWGWGHPLRIWLGPLVGARLPDVEAYGDEDDWTPPPNAIPFGPFLALGALSSLLFQTEIETLFRQAVTSLVV